MHEHIHLRWQIQQGAGKTYKSIGKLKENCTEPKSENWELKAGAPDTYSNELTLSQLGTEICMF